MIAEKLASQVDEAERAELHAVGSRSPEKANEFGSKFNCRPYGSYEAVLSDPDIEAVYLALPNRLHHGWACRALDAGKHVLCEKPLATCAADAEDMFAAAGKANRVLIEAFMYRTTPRIRKAIEMVHAGAIGQLKIIRSNFCFQRTASRNDARYDSQHGGGALMDVGCYPLNFSRALTGAEPTAVHAMGHLHEFGVDDYSAGLLRFDHGVLLTFTCGMTVATDWSTVIAGTEGWMTIDNTWLGDNDLVLTRGDEQETIQTTSEVGCYAQELNCFAATVQDGEPPFITAADSLGNMRILDTLRRQIGIPV